MKLFLITLVLICEIIRPSSFSDVMTSNVTLSECINRCEYSDNCMGLIYQNDTCLISSSLEISDNSNYNNTGQIVYAKQNLKYYGQKCAKFNKKKCNLFSGCKWKYGTPAYNRVYRRGWCGRYSCD